MKIISMYLPQFHRVPENDSWWGKGFTDWVPTKGAKMLFEGHQQPHIPLGNNYYDLMQKETMQWQAELMHKYGVDGQCIYHYWFKDGRQILEKPIENLLAWKDIDMPFCFCWANETWARSWSNIKTANVWADTDNKINNRKKNTSENKNGDNGILLEQSYGEQADWKAHFDYLLPFFKDSRYIKNEGKPVFLIYRSSEITCLSEMVEYFQDLAMEHGLPGVYFICANAKNNVPANVDATLTHEPQNCMRNLATFQTEEVACLNYQQCWDYVLSNQGLGKKHYFEGFVSYDDTPRRGVKGTAIVGNTPKIFKDNMVKLFAKSEVAGNELVFVNAWNEWGEGMYLEPDETERYGYLEAICEAKKEYKHCDFTMSHDVDIEEYRRVVNQRDKYEIYLNTLDQWMTMREKNISVTTYLKERNCKKIAIYGYGIYARHLLEEVKGADVEVVSLIDRQGNRLSLDLPVISPEDPIEGVDAIVVTSFYYYDEIKEIFKNKKIPIISVETMIKEVAGRDDDRK